MATQAKKVWCPQCHKRHQLPPDVGEMTLRCRRCRFAFHLSDGLTSDPAIEKPTQNAAFDDAPDLDDNYDDILDVLSSTEAPPRAHAKPKSNQFKGGDGDSATGEEHEQTEPSPRIAEPVTRQRLRTHKNTRRILMLLSFLFACVLCVVSWFIGRDLADKPLVAWERKMLYAMGVPARLLPPQNVNDEMLLPVDHVKLRGDFIELADRSDSYRDEFPRPERELDTELKPRPERERKPEREPRPERERKPRPELANAAKPPSNTAPTSPRHPANPPTTPSPIKVDGSGKKLVDAKPKTPKKPDAKLERRGLLLPNQAAIDLDDLFLHELARSASFSAPLESLVALSDNRIVFFAKDKDYQAFGIAQRDENEWSIKQIELSTKLTVKGFDITEDGRRIAIWSRDIIQFWEVADSGAAKLIAESVLHSAEITQLKLTNDGMRAVSGDRSGKLFISAFETGQRIDSVEGFRTAIKCIVAKGTTGFVAMDQRGITRGVRAKIVPFGTAVSGACALSLNGNKLAYANFGRKVVVADVSSRKINGSFQVQPSCSSLAFANDLRYLITQEGNDVAVWDWRRSERLRIFRFQRNQNGRPVPVAIASDSQTVAVATSEKRNQISIYEMPGAETESQ